MYENNKNIASGATKLREQDLIYRDNGYYNENLGKRKLLDNKEKSDDNIQIFILITNGAPNLYDDLHSLYFSNPKSKFSIFKFIKF